MALLGDLALLHDLGALYGAARAGLQITVVCVDNDGGAIFSMLPIATRADDIDLDTLFRTPHGLDLHTLGGTGGVRAAEVHSADELAEAVARAAAARTAGVDLLVARVDPAADMAARRAVTAAVHRAVEQP